MEKAAQGSMSEVQLGQLAAQKASSDQVKKFGQRMVSDHSKAADDLKTIAASKDVTLPSEVPAAEKKEYERLSKLSGEQFDQEYVKHMVSDHQKDVSEFQSATRSASDPDVKAFAQKTLPVIQDHLQQVTSLSRDRKTSSSSEPRNTSSASQPGTTMSSNTAPSNATSK